MTARSMTALARRARTLAADLREMDEATAASIEHRTTDADGEPGDLVRSLAALRAAVEPLTRAAVEHRPNLRAESYHDLASRNRHWAADNVMLSQVLDVLDGRGMSQRKCATLNEAAAMIARTLGMDRLELAQRLCDPDAEPTLLAALYVISGANNRGRSKQHVKRSLARLRNMALPTFTAADGCATTWSPERDGS